MQKFVPHGPNVVFMPMREQQCVQLPTLGFDKARVGGNHIDTRFGMAPECDAEVDHNPVPFIAGAITIEIAIHADLAGTAQGNKNQIFIVCCHLTTD